MRKRMACRLMLDDELGADERGMSSAVGPSGRKILEYLAGTRGVN